MLLAVLALVAGLSVTPAAAGAIDTCTTSTGSWQWGVKESLRAYISGSIAEGEWSVSGDIDYATPLFFSDALSGELGLPTLTGALAADGAMRFTGHGGILDTTIADPVLVFSETGSVTLVADITGTTQDFVPVDVLDVPFVVGDLSGATFRVEGESLVIDAIPLSLTADGAAAFGTYLEGEAFDPLTLTLPVGAPCAAATVEAQAAGPGGIEADSTALLVGAAVLAAALGAALTGLMVARARRRTGDEQATPEGGASAD